MSVVYFIECADASAVKVGWARDPHKRLREHQAGCPLPLALLATFPGAAKVESRLHRALVGSRIHGEWFESGHVKKFLEAASEYGFGDTITSYEETASLYRGLAQSSASRMLSQSEDWLSIAEEHWRTNGLIAEFVENNVGAQLVAIGATA